MTNDNSSNTEGPVESYGLKDGVVRRLFIHSIVCASAKCQALYLKVGLYNMFTEGTKRRRAEKIREWALLPESTAKPQPDYIPPQLRQDYLEACRIVSLSPKASATLARRCLQGMIRDFCQINMKSKRLNDEIRELKRRVDNHGADPAIPPAPAGVSIESVTAIDHVRSIGNIGAHMEQDVDLIIDIDAGEAGHLIGLVEALFAEWYVERHKRQERFATISAIAADKAQQKGAAAPRPPKQTKE